MVSTCLRGRSLLGACSETTKTDRQWDQHLPIRFTSQTVDFVRCYVVSSRVYATLRAIPCPNVAWSGVGLHLECMGPSIIPLCKYLQKETGLLPLAKTRESSWGTLFFNTIYSYRERECVRQERQRRGKKGQCGTRNQKKVVGRGWWIC